MSRFSSSFLLCFLLFAGVAYATPTITAQTAGDKITLNMSENLSVSAFNFTVTGGAIKSIAYTGEDDKLAASWRNRAIVYGLNDDIISDGEICEVQVVGFGSREVGLTGFVAANDNATAAECTVQQTPVSFNNARTVAITGPGKTVVVIY